MSEISVQNWKKETLRSIELDDGVFDYPLKKHLLYEAVLAYQAAGRSGTHATKNRKNVSGGTSKVWRQKGTGRARVGDNRSPLWRHGGTVHGPQPRDYSWDFPKKMRRNALRSALAQKFRDGKLICLDTLEYDSHKTSALDQTMVGVMGIEEKTLLVSLDEQKNLTLAARNNPQLTVVRALGMSIVDLLNHDTILISESALQRLSEVLAS
jgi:large subunit ribosomal protein L4